MSRRRWRVRFTGRSATDLVRLIEFQAARDLRAAQQAREAIAHAIAVLERLPFSSRPARLSNRSSLRELLVPHGRSGYVLLLEVEPGTVTILRIRHQLESGDD